MPERSYNTKQRQLVLEYITQSGSGHITAQEITEKLLADGTGIGAATVYRCLDRLTKDGVLLKYPGADGGSACYQLAEHCRDRCFHMKCVECGMLYHVECGHLEDAVSHIFEEHGFTVDGFKTVFYGVCKNCKNR